MAITQLQGQRTVDPAATQMLMQGFGQLANQRNQRRVNLVKQTEDYAAAHGGFANMLAQQGEQGSAILDQYLTEGLGYSRRELPKLYEEFQSGANMDEKLYAARQNADISQYLNEIDQQVGGPQPEGGGAQQQQQTQTGERFDLNAPQTQGFTTGIRQGSADAPAAQQGEGVGAGISNGRGIYIPSNLSRNPEGTTGQQSTGLYSNTPAEYSPAALRSGDITWMQGSEEGTLITRETVGGENKYVKYNRETMTPIATAKDLPSSETEKPGDWEQIVVEEEDTMTRLIDLDTKIDQALPRGVPHEPGSREWNSVVYGAISRQMGLDQGNQSYGYLIGKSEEQTKEALERAGKTERDVLIDVASATGIQFENLQQVQYYRQVMGQAQLDKAEGTLTDPANMQLRLDVAKEFGNTELSDQQKFGGLFKSVPYETVVDGKEDPSKGQIRTAATQVRNQVNRDVQPFARDIRRLYQQSGQANEFLRTANELRRMDNEQFYGMFPQELAKDLNIEKMRASSKDREYKDALIGLTEAQTRYQGLQNALVQAQQDADPAAAEAAQRLKMTLDAVGTVLKSPNYDEFDKDFQLSSEKIFMDIMSSIGVTEAEMKLIKNNGFLRFIGGSDMKAVFSPGSTPQAEANPLVGELYAEMSTR